MFNSLLKSIINDNFTSNYFHFKFDVLSHHAFQHLLKKKKKVCCVHKWLFLFGKWLYLSSVLTSSHSGKAKTRDSRQSIISPDWNFEKMGIGGLDKEFSDIFRRAFASRVFPPDIVEQMGEFPLIVPHPPITPSFVWVFSSCRNAHMQIHPAHTSASSSPILNSTLKNSIIQTVSCYSKQD